MRFWIREEINDLLTLSALLPTPSRQHTEGRWAREGLEIQGRWAREGLEIQGSQSCGCQWLTHPSFPLWTRTMAHPSLLPTLGTEGETFAL